MHRSIVALAAILSSAVIVPAALADQPTRQPSPIPSPLLVSGSCSFDVQLDILANKEIATTFTSGKQIITGRLVARATNLDNPTKSIVLQVSGPGIEDLANPLTFNLSGTSLIFFPGVMVLTRGPASLTFDENGNVTSFTLTSASSVDLCAVLADP